MTTVADPAVEGGTVMDSGDDIAAIDTIRRGIAVSPELTEGLRGTLALAIVAGAAGNIYFQSAAAGAVIFGGSTNLIKLAANGGFVLPFSPVGWFETDAGELLNLNASSTGPFSGGLAYIAYQP